MQGEDLNLKSLFNWRHTLLQSRCGGQGAIRLVAAPLAISPTLVTSRTNLKMSSPGTAPSEPVTVINNGKNYLETGF